MRYFYYVSWLIELLVGIGLFAVSFLVQNEVLQAFMSSAVLALFLAIVLESGKVAAIVWHRYFINLDSAPYPESIRVISLLFRFGLLGLSMLCSLIYLSSHLDRPNIKQIRAEEIKRYESMAEQRTQALHQEQKQLRLNLQDKQKTELSVKQKLNQQRILAIESAIKNEMDNVVRGVFQGPRYKELKARLTEMQRLNLHELDKIKQQQFKESQALNQLLNQQKQAFDEKIQQQLAENRQAVLNNDYATDERVNHPKVVAFLKVSESVFNITLEPLQFVFVFSILISLLMELGILLSFDTVTLSIHSLMVKQQVYEIEKETLKADMQAKKDSADIKHEADMDFIKKSAARTTDKASAYFHHSQVEV